MPSRACLAGKFDIIFLDPPYDTTLLDKCLEIVQNVDILTDGGIIVCESRREKTLPELKASIFARYRQQLRQDKDNGLQKEI